MATQETEATKTPKTQKYRVAYGKIGHDDGSGYKVYRAGDEIQLTKETANAYPNKFTPVGSTEALETPAFGSQYDEKVVHVAEQADTSGMLDTAQLSLGWQEASNYIRSLSDPAMVRQAIDYEKGTKGRTSVIETGKTRLEELG
jgi:hypothetical protein